MVRRTVLLWPAAAGLLFATISQAGVSSGDAVVSYSAGTFTGAYTGPSSSWTTGPGLGTPATTEGGLYGDDSIITPFNAQYNPANMFGLSGSGGSVDIHLSSPVSTSGYGLGVFTGIGLQDPNYDGNTTDPATFYNGTGRSATVQVSADGTHWVSLGDLSFDNPTNAYADASGPYTSTPGNTLADFSKPFTGSLSSFNGEDFSQVLSTLDGSAGGTWLNLSGTGLPAVNYVEFTTASAETLYIEGVTGTAVPEPVAGVALLAGTLLLRRRRCAL